MERLTRTSAPSSVKASSLTERVIQFGEGNFLRGFVEASIHEANRQGQFDGSVVVLQPIAQGLAGMLNEQDGLYTLVLRGMKDGGSFVSEDLVSAISRSLSCTAEWDAVLACADQPEMDVVISNTTEAGIAYSDSDRPNDLPPASFPGKLCAFLYRRFQSFSGDPDRGMLIIPCELIDRNGDQLREIVLRLAREWDLGDEFVAWLYDHNIFANSLVDRIVTGYPGAEESAEFNNKWGYEDRLIVTAEPFFLWVIEGPKEAAERFPVHRSGLDVVWVDDMTPYRTRKVRILNGAHTATVAAAHFSGIDFVREAVEDEVLGRYIRSIVFDEIIPTLDMERSELENFAEQVIERFQNPFIKHRWLDISLNSVSKFKARVLPSLLTHLDAGRLPTLLTFSLAATIRFYRGSLDPGGSYTGFRGDEPYVVRDDADVLAFSHEAWADHTGDHLPLAQRVLSNTAFWGDDLSRYDGLSERVGEFLDRMNAEATRDIIAGLLPETPSS
jgi:tagaturonate reductase